MEDVPSVAALEADGGRVVASRAAQTIAGDTVFVSGEIPRTSGFEIGLPGQHRRTEDGTGWEPDELLMDERFIAVNVRDKGLVVLTACSHAGVINVLSHARACFPGVKLHAVLGGLHLSGINERVIPQTVKALRLRSRRHRRRPLHRLARHGRPCQRIRRHQAGPSGSGQAAAVLS